jgi:hypothetical protein
MNETATRSNGVQEQGDEKMELIARNYAETGFRKLFEGVAWLASHFQDTETEFRVLGKSLTVNPKVWKYEHTIHANVGLGAGNNEKSVENLQGLYALQQQQKAQGSSLVDDKKIFNTVARITDGLGFPRTNEFFNNPEESDELLRHENEILNANGLQQQQMIEALTEQIKQLQALSEVELIKLEGKREADDKKAALGVAKLNQDDRHFNVDALQEHRKQDESTALEITKLELDNNTDLPGGLQ